MANTVFNIAKKFLVSSSSGQYDAIDLINDTIKVALVNSGYTVEQDDDVFQTSGSTTDPESAELSGTGYTGGIGGSGRKTLASKTITEDDTNDRADFDAADVTWTSIDAGTAAAAMLLKEGGAGTTTSDTGTILIAYIDSGFPVVTNGGDLTIQWSTGGIIQLS